MRDLDGVCRDATETAAFAAAMKAQYGFAAMGSVAATARELVTPLLHPERAVAAMVLAGGR